MRFLTVLLATSLWLCGAAQAQLDEELELGPTQRRLTHVTVELPPILSAGQTFEARVVFQVPRGFHIYGPQETRWGPTAVKIANTASLTFGKPIYPAATLKLIPDLGQTAIYQGRVVVRIRGTVKARPSYLDGRQEVAIVTGWSTCNDRVCREIRTLTRNPHRLRAQTLVALAIPRMSGPAQVTAGQTFQSRIRFQIPKGYHVRGVSLSLSKVPGIRWGKPVFPKSVDGTYHGSPEVAVTDAVETGAALGPRTVRATLRWGTCDAEGCHEAVLGHQITRKIEIRKAHR